MNTVYQQKEQANSLRKLGNVEEALPIYKELWNSSKDKFDAAGYLHCLRKLKKYEDAFLLANECEKIFVDFKWCRDEIIWTYIGYLKQVKENEAITNTLSIAYKIMNLDPEDQQKNTTVLAVLKKAKQFKKWNIAVQWVDKINPDSLDKKTMIDEKGRPGWSYHLLWHQHKVRCLILQEKYHEAIQLVGDIISQANQQAKFFRSLEAHAYAKLGDTAKAIEILEELCRNKRVEWWIANQHATILKNAGEREKALEKMYLAATLSFKLESIVTMLYEIAILCKELNRMEESYYHLMLYKFIRENNKWAVKEDVEQLIIDTSTGLPNTKSINYKFVLTQCRAYWATGFNSLKDVIDVKRKNQLRKALKGDLIQVKEDKPFCFIKSQEESFFCYKSDIKGEPKEGIRVRFDVIPTFDKKKQKESWKAINIVLI
ncbi:tetratricopeptide repeat protein [Paenibacillus sp. MCAF9]|uniref:tetratricopeptide repeat protein n=1 Tax=Paenibacillus sp. MCAF9 TaxID=3233046 RepID=UPI003F9CD270